MAVFVFSIENRVTYARFKHVVYTVSSKMADHSKRVGWLVGSAFSKAKFSEFAK